MGDNYLLFQLLLSEGDAHWHQSPSLGHAASRVPADATFPQLAGYLCQARARLGFAAPLPACLTCSSCVQDMLGFQKR